MIGDGLVAVLAVGVLWLVLFFITWFALLTELKALDPPSEPGSSLLGPYNGESRGKLVITYALEDPKGVEAVLGKKASRRIGVWAVTVTNVSEEQVGVDEALVRREAVKLGLDAIGPREVELRLKHLSKGSGWRVAYQATSVAAVALSLVVNLDIVKSGSTFIGPGAVQAVNVFAAEAPRLGEFLLGQAVPAVENFHHLNKDVVMLGELGTGAGVLFTGPYRWNREKREVRVAEVELASH